MNGRRRRHKLRARVVGWQDDRRAHNELQPRIECEAIECGARLVVAGDCRCPIDADTRAFVVAAARRRRRVQRFRRRRFSFERPTNLQLASH